jgi:RimJ/RimL family protein N-acetyltransferase
VTTEIAMDDLHLRAYRRADAAALYAAVRESVDSVGRWLPWCHAGYDEAEALAWIDHCIDGWQRGEHFAFAIFDAATAELLGAVGLNQRNRQHNNMNLGFWIRQSRQREGIATRAARAIVAFGFRDVALVRIEIIAQPDNRASRRVAETLGARFEGFARNRLMFRGEPAEAAVYALIPGDVVPLPQA